jgi:hypothetical protein
MDDHEVLIVVRVLASPVSLSFVVAFVVYGRNS